MYGKSFVELIERELKTRGISKGEFYKGSGISSSTFSQWRSGEYSPSSEGIKRVEDFLGMRFEINEKPAPPVGSGLSENEEMIFKLLRTRKDRDAAGASVIAFLQALPNLDENE